MQSSTPPGTGSERFLLHKIESRPRYLDSIQNQRPDQCQPAIDLRDREASCKVASFFPFCFWYWLSRVLHWTLDSAKIKSASGYRYFQRFHIQSLSRMRTVFLKRTV